MRSAFAIGVVLVCAVPGCGGDQYGGMNMPSAAPSAPGASIVTITGPRGMLSFDPNPAAFPPGALVVWHNADTATHRIVMNDGSFDSGMIAPGGSSAMMRLGGGGSYHCTVHPTMMFGSITSTY